MKVEKKSSYSSAIKFLALSLKSQHCSLTSSLNSGGLFLHIIVYLQMEKKLKRQNPCQMEAEEQIQERNQEKEELMDQEPSLARKQSQSLSVASLDFQKPSEKRLKSKKQMLRQILTDLNKLYPLNEYIIILICLQLIDSNPKGILVNEAKKKLQEIGYLNPVLERYFQKVKGGVEKTKLKGDDGYRTLYRALEIQLPIDCFELQERCKNSRFKDAEKRLILLGADRVGKTTFLQTLLSYQHSRSKQGKQVYLQAQDLEEQVMQTYRGPQKVTTQMAQYQAKIKNDKISIVDGPGFWDSNGAQLDIASQVDLEKVYKNCKSIYYLLVINPAQLNSQQIKKAVRRIAQRFQYKTREQLESNLLIIFNFKSGKADTKNANQSLRLLKQDEKTGIKQRIALQLITLSLQNIDHHYKPLQNDSVERVRKLVSRIKFDGKKPMKYDFEDKTLRTITMCCQVVIRNIAALIKNNKLDEICFYYDIIYSLSAIIPHYVKSTKQKADKMLQNKSCQPYDKLTSKFRQMVSQLNNEEGWFGEVKLVSSQLIAFNKLSQINPKIKSQKELRQNLNGFAAKLKEKVQENIESDKIQSLCQFIQQFYQAFSLYLPQFFEQIEKKCFDSLQNRQKQIEDNFAKQQSQAFEQNMDKYQKMFIFYEHFAKINPAIFKRKQQIPTQNKLKSDYLSEIKILQNQILQKKKIIFTKQDISAKQSIKILDKSFAKFKQFSKISCLDLKERLIALQEGLKKDFSSKSEKIYGEFKKCFQIGDQSQSRRNSLLVMIAKIRQAQQTTSFSELQQYTKSFNCKIAELLLDIEEQARKKIYVMMLCLKESKIYREQGCECFNLKIQTLDRFKKAFGLQNNNYLRQQYGVLVKKMQQISLKIQKDIDLKDKPCNYAEPLRLLKISSSISNAVEQFKKGHSDLDDKLTKQLLQDNKNFQDKVAKMKVENLESLQRNLNRLNITQFQIYTVNIVNPFRNTSYLIPVSENQDMEDDDSQATHLSYETQLKNTWQIVCRFFTEVDSMIRRNDAIRFPSSLRQSSQFINAESLLIQASKYIDILVYIYSVTHNFANNYRVLDNYLKFAFERQEVHIDVSQMEIHIKCILQEKLKKVQELLPMINQQGNVMACRSLLKQCKAWKKLQLKIVQDSQRLKIPSLARQIETALSGIEGSHANFIKEALTSDYSIDDTQKFIELYFELRSTSNQKSSSSQNFRQLKSHLSTYLIKLNDFLKRNYRCFLDFKPLCKQFTLKFQDLVDFYRLFDEKISKILENKSSEEEIISQIVKILNFMFQEIKKNFLQAKNSAQQQIKQRDKYKANQCIDKMNKLAQMIKKLEILQIGNSQQYFQTIRQLKAGIDQNTQKEQQILSRSTIQIGDFPLIQNLIEGKDKKTILIRLRDCIKRQIQKISQVSWEYRQAKITLFENSVFDLPPALPGINDLQSKIKELRHTFRRQQQEFVNKIKGLDMNSQPDRKKIISGFNSLKRNDDKRFILDRIRIYLKEVAWPTIVERQTRVKDKISIYQRQVQGLYELILNAHQSIKNIIKQIEQDFLKALLQALKQNTESFIALLQKKKSQRPTCLNETLEDIFITIMYLEKKSGILFLKQQADRIAGSFNDFVNKVVLFEKYCPIRQYEKENNNKVTDVLRRVMNKLALYDELLQSALKYDQISCGTQFQDQYEGGQQIQMMDVGEEKNQNQENPKNVFGQLYSQIQSVKSSIRNRIEAAIQVLKNFSFSSQESLGSDINDVVEKKVSLLEKNLGEIQRMTLVSQENPTLRLINLEEVNKLGLQLKKKQEKYVEKIITELYIYISNLEAQMPKDLYFLFLLLENIAQKKVTHLQIDNSGNKKQVKMTTNDQLIGKFNDLKDKLETNVNQKEQQIINFIVMVSPEKQSKILQLKRQKADHLRQKQEEKQKRRKIVEIDNQGKRIDQIQRLTEEAMNQLNVQISYQQEVFKERIEAATKEKVKLIQDMLEGFSLGLIKLTKSLLARQNFLNQQGLMKKIITQKLHSIEKLKLVKQLSLKLSSFDCDEIVYSIKSSCKIFQFETQAQFIDKTSPQDIDYALKGLKTKQELNSNEQDRMEMPEQLSKQEIRQKYKLIMQVFTQWANSGKSIQEMKEYLSSADDLEYLAIILAVWSNLSTFRGTDNQIVCGPIPHPVQVVTLILLTNKNKASKNLQSKLAQVKTGQGKSLILATLAIFYARLEYKVKVVCYSQYLSQRDYQAFRNLFQAFNVTDKIFYGTFNQVCQQFLNNQKENFRDTVKKFLIEDNSLPENTLSRFFGNKQQQSSKSIILLDQVDVMVQSDYLGRTFVPVARLDESEFKTLIQYAYEFYINNGRITPKDLFNSQAYKICLRKFHKLAEILEIQVLAMVQALTSDDKHTYQVHKNQIKYKEKDRLSANVHYGYRTIFANCREFAAGKISRSNYEKNLFIPIKIGELSYSQLPGQSIIQGSSGTVASLSSSKDTILHKKYNIPQNFIYILPSIYGKKNAIVPVYHLVVQQTFYQRVALVIKAEHEKGRPIVVCFQNHDELKEFEKSRQFKELRITPSYLHELQDSVMRDNAIKGAGRKKNVTLMTSEFSRGTDILVIDRAAIKNGGLVAIMAYIPKSQTQFQQFKGRTGRQGNNGSIEIVFNSDEFAKILNQHKLSQQIKVAQQTKEIMANLYNLWAKLDKLEMEEKIVQLQMAKKKHCQFLQILQNMGKTGRQQEFVQYVKKLNNFQPQKKSFRILFGIDGTASMKIIFLKLKDTLKTIVARTNEIKNDFKNNCTFQLNIAVYRNYNTGAKILESTESQKTIEELTKFLDRVNVHGGQGNQAIEVLYRYINNADTEFDMLIQMGDAPPNTLDQIPQKKAFTMKDKKKIPNFLWQSFQRSPNYKKQLFDVKSSELQIQKFKKDFVIHGLAIKTNPSEGSQTCNKRFEEYIESLCNKFKGQCKTLDFAQREAQEDLIQFITTKISLLINNSKDKQLMEKIYREKFSNSYI